MGDAGRRLHRGGERCVIGMRLQLSELNGFRWRRPTAWA